MDDSKLLNERNLTATQPHTVRHKKGAPKNLY